MKISICCKWMAGIIGALIFTLVPVVSAGEKTGAGPELSPEKPLHVTADKMVAHQDGFMVEFIGNVRAEQGDTLLLAQSINILFHPSQPDTGDPETINRIKQIVASDDVEYTAGDRQAFSDKAVYTAADDILVLTGKDVKLLTGASWVSGTKITLFRQQDRIMVESDGKARVQALFNPEDKPADQ